MFEHFTGASSRHNYSDRYNGDFGKKALIKKEGK